MKINCKKYFIIFLIIFFVCLISIGIYAIKVQPFLGIQKISLFEKIHSDNYTSQFSYFFENNIFIANGYSEQGYLYDFDGCNHSDCMFFSLYGFNKDKNPHPFILEQYNEFKYDIIKFIFNNQNFNVKISNLDKENKAMIFFEKEKGIYLLNISVENKMSNIEFSNSIKLLVEKLSID